MSDDDRLRRHTGLFSRRKLSALITPNVERKTFMNSNAGRARAVGVPTLIIWLAALPAPPALAAPAAAKTNEVTKWNAIAQGTVLAQPPITSAPPASATFM